MLVLVLVVLLLLMILIIAKLKLSLIHKCQSFKNEAKIQLWKLGSRFHLRNIGNQYWDRQFFFNNNQTNTAGQKIKFSVMSGLEGVSLMVVVMDR